MKISAHNVLSGTVKEVREGAVTAHVVIDIGGERTITAAITKQAVPELGLAPGKPAHAVSKSSDVLVAVD